MDRISNKKRNGFLIALVVITLQWSPPAFSTKVGPSESDIHPSKTHLLGTAHSKQEALKRHYEHSYKRFFLSDAYKALHQKLHLLTLKDHEEIEAQINQELAEAKERKMKGSTLGKVASLFSKLDIQTAMNIQNIIKTKIGYRLLFHAIQTTANKLDCAFATRAVNESSLPGIVDGLPTKPMAIKGKSADSGLLKGFIPVDQSLSKIRDNPSDVAHYNELNHEVLEKKSDRFKAVPLVREHPLKKNKTLTLVQDREGIQKWATEKELKEHTEYTPILVMGAKSARTEDGSFEPIVADLDPLFIAEPTDSYFKAIVKARLVGAGKKVMMDDTKGAYTDLYPLAIQLTNESIGNKNPVVHHGGAELDPHNTPLGQTEAVYVAIPKRTEPTMIMGEKNGPSTQDKLDEYMTHQDRKYLSVGTNTSMAKTSIRPKGYQVEDPTDDSLHPESIIKARKVLRNLNIKKITPVDSNDAIHPHKDE